MDRNLLEKITEEFNSLRKPECYANIKEVKNDYLIIEFYGTKINFACCFDENFIDYQYYLKDFSGLEFSIKEIKREGDKFIVKYIKKEGK
ncbi:MAG: hypothetical protein N2323_00785 [candidate division WOR-3 bacterium]|nr:hypothetical protein [candidate division WOR-3 bacterium]MCX7836481.1 hypothetical protein [candidate division WOR-3 bacterium]